MQHSYIILQPNNYSIIPIASNSGWQVFYPDPDDAGDDDDHDDGAECNIRI